MSTKRPAVFFDRDNTLIVTNDYLGDPDRVQLYDGASQAVARAKDLGYLVVVFSNQSGVARGMYGEADVLKVNQRLDELLQTEHDQAVIDRHEFCPEHPSGSVAPYNRESPRRKPAPGMLFDAAKALDIDLSQSWAVGDAPRDVEAGKRAGCRTILLKDPSVPASLAASEKLTVEPDYIAASLEDAMDFVEMHRDSPKVVSLPAREIAPETAVEAEPETEISPESSPLSAPVSSTEPTLPPIVTSRPTAVFSSPPPAPQVDPANDKVVMDPIIKELKTLQRQQSQIIDELRHLSDKPQDFSVARLVAGIMLGLSLAALVSSWFYTGSGTQLTLMLLAIWLQVGVASLMLMASSK
jgi:D-glycero-D-manno-heptose 1,7-bisphosphate phosphatase